MKSSESKESHYLSWGSHIGPKNKRWLQENLEDINRNVKWMFKLIDEDPDYNDEDADSFVKKYYRKRPELLYRLETIYRMYKAFVERYELVARELRKSIPTDLQSRDSGISDVSSEPSALDTESESDDSSEYNYVGVLNSDEDQGLRKKIIELEVELLDVKEKFRMLQEEISEGTYRGSKSGDSGVLLTRIAGYEEELKVTREINELSEEEINKLKVELQKYKSMEQFSKLEGEIDLSSLFQGKHHKMKRSESKKSHSWWWDSHINPRSNRWLQENIVEVDQNVKRMLDVIDQAGISLVRKTEIYYQRRPELMSVAEEIYHSYRAMVESYYHLTVEIQKNIPNDVSSKPSALYSESESDDSSENDYVGVQNCDEDQGLRKRIVELEVELLDVKEKFRMLQEEISESSCRDSKSGESRGPPDQDSRI